MRQLIRECMALDRGKSVVPSTNASACSNSGWPQEFFELAERLGVDPPRGSVWTFEVRGQFRAG
jgi:hypothetical protein